MPKGRNKRQVGGEYEQKAAKYLREAGYKILEMNFRCRSGEIDVIAKDNGYLVFIEVKYRTTAGSGNPVEAVDWKKQQQISKVAMFYMISHGFSMETPCRFDVVAVLKDEITLYRNAFEYCGA